MHLFKKAVKYIVMSGDQAFHFACEESGCQLTMHSLLHKTDGKVFCVEQNVKLEHHKLDYLLFQFIYGFMIIVINYRRVILFWTV